MKPLTRYTVIIRSFAVAVIAALCLAWLGQPALGRPTSAKGLQQQPTGVWVLARTYIEDQSLSPSDNCYNLTHTVYPENQLVESAVDWKFTSDRNDECYIYNEPYYSHDLTCTGSAQDSQSWTPMPTTIVPGTKYPMTLKAEWSAEQSCDFITVRTHLTFLGLATVEITKPATYCDDNDSQLRGEFCVAEAVAVPYEYEIDKNASYSTGPQVQLGGDSGLWPGYDSRYGVPPPSDEIEFNFWLPEGDHYYSGEQIRTVGFFYSDIGGSAVINYEYHWQPADAQPTPAEPTPTQAVPVTLEGVVTIEGTNLPLGDVPIVLFKNGQQIDQSITMPDGSYQFPLQLERPVEGLSLKISLEDAVTQPPAFQVIYEPDPDPVAGSTLDFEIPADEDPIFKYDIAFGGTDLIAEQTMPSDLLPDMGMVYYYTRQSFQEAYVFRKQTLDFNPPLSVRVNNPRFEALGAFWLGPNSRGAGNGMAPYIGLSERMSRIAQLLSAGGVIWHEFGHDVMADAYGNMQPYDRTGTAHRGFFNPSTTDSWVEGFATFFALLTNREFNPTTNTSVWYGGGYSVNMEVNYRAIYGYYDAITPTSREEFAVTALLWDLVDPQDPEDCSPLMYNAKVGELFKITPAAPIADTQLTLYCDYMELDTQALWTMITADASKTDPSPAAGNFPYIYDVKQLYEVLVANGVGEHITPNGITALDELFIAHGFYADTSPQNFAYDSGEKLGLTNNLAFRRGSANFPARNLRRSPPPLVNSSIGVAVQDSKTGQLAEVNQYQVTVLFEPPYELYNYSYMAPVASPGQLYIEPPDSLYATTFTITPIGSGLQSSQPLEFTSTQYWEWMNQHKSGNFINHTFQTGEGKPSSTASNPTTQSKTKTNWPIIMVTVGCCCLLILGIATTGGALFFIRRSKAAKR